MRGSRPARLGTLLRREQALLDDGFGLVGYNQLTSVNLPYTLPDRTYSIKKKSLKKLRLG
jgi:hypothetical protein